MTPDQQARAVAIDLALKMPGKQGRPSRAADVVEMAKVFHHYIRDGR